MRRAYLILLVAVAVSLMAQSPVTHTYAFSRDTIPGIPGGGATGPQQNPFPTAYFIYVTVKKGTPLSAGGVWLRGKWRAAALKKVQSPVLIEHDTAVPTGKKDTLVGKTGDDVYQVELGDSGAREPEAGVERKLIESNDVVVVLKSAQSSWYGIAAKIVALHHAAAM
jgi:hypothetical protein